MRLVMSDMLQLVVMIPNTQAMILPVTSHVECCQSWRQAEACRTLLTPWDRGLNVCRYHSNHLQFRGDTTRRSGSFRCAGCCSGDKIPHRVRRYAGPYGLIGACPVHRNNQVLL